MLLPSHLQWYSYSSQVLLNARHISVIETRTDLSLPKAKDARLVRMCCSTSGSLFKLNSRHSAWIPPQSRISSLYLKINAYGLDTRINLLAIQQLQTDLTTWVCYLMLGGHHLDFHWNCWKGTFLPLTFALHQEVEGVGNVIHFI